jgi:DNA-binding transcriptional LysR family regulator
VNLHQLKVFCLVAAEGSFSAAADKLFMTQPAVTLQIKNLEDYYQVKFFERTGKKVLLTEEGKVLLGIAGQMLDLNRKAEEVVADMKGFSRGSVHIAASLSFIDYYLPPLLNAFHEKYPNIFFEISEGNTSQLIENTLLHKNDLAFVASRPVNQRLIVRQFVRDTLVAIIPLKHKLAARESVTLNELNREPLILREPGSSIRELVDEAFHKRGMKPFLVMQSASTTAIKKMVESGAGIGILSEQLVSTEVAAGAFRAVRFTEVEMMVPFYLIYHKDKYFSRTLKAFVDMAFDFADKPWLEY